MKQKFLFLLSGVILTFMTATPSLAGFIYQNFEPNNGTVNNNWSLADRHETVHLGINALKISAGTYWAVTPVFSQISAGEIDFLQNKNDRLTFWIYALPQRACYVYGCENGSDNTVSVTFYDNDHYSTGFEVWTDKKARYQQWTKLGVLFSQLPPDFDLHHVTRVDFKNYLPGKYYLDDIHVVREDRVYQSFNQESRPDTTVSDYGWKWNDADTIALSIDGEPVYEGGHSWKLISTGKWGGNGFQSEQQTYFLNPQGQVEQSFWHNNFLLENNDRLSLWVYGLPENGMDNNINVQFYDHGNHSTDETKGEVWTKRSATYGKWTRLEAFFSELKDKLGQPITDFNFQDIDKIQVQHYWAGTFYIDDIRATGPYPRIKESTLMQGTVQWNAVTGAENYRLQESVDGPNGPWLTIFSGPQTNFNIVKLSKTWLRVRWEEEFVDHNSLPYASSWSDVVEYNPPAVVLKFSSLANGLLTWNTIPQTTMYELQSSPAITGPWTQLYKGPLPATPLTATLGKWYRVRAVQQYNNSLTDYAPWSRPQIYAALGTRFVKASGKVLKDKNGSGNELVLNGVNLGNVLLIEDWMTGLGLADSPVIADEWTLREVLISRFGIAETENLLRTFENAYLNDFDFDRLKESNVTLVRLPLYYRNIMDDNGNFILNSQGQIDFTQIDRIVDAMADRGIYILLDLHGAPGSQSNEFHTGRKNFNKLFEVSPVGENYRTRTETLWKEIARHYKDNPWVLGYDLLNEPIGAPYPQALAELYDRLYDAIRTIDNNHLIVMEGIWDWETLPHPIDFNWQNVMYQFHYYCPMIPEPQNPGDPQPVMGVSCADYGPMSTRLSYQQAFINAKVASSRQNLYQVPAMVGEFNAHDHKEAWEYYLQTFNTKKWSWTMWSYKDRSSPSSWGIFNHAKYDEALPKFRTDSLQDLTRKLSKFTTTDYHVPNWTLQGILKNYGIFPLHQTTKPEIFSLGPRNTIYSPSTFTISGRNFGASQGASKILANGGELPQVHWADKEIEAYFPTGQAPGTWTITVTTAQGVSNPEDLIFPNVESVPSAGLNIQPDGSFVYLGKGMCDTPGTIKFYPDWCNDVPQGSIACNLGDAAIISWSPTLIRGLVPPDYSPGSFGGAQMSCIHGGELYPTMIPDNQPPVLDSIANRVVMEGQLLSFSISATDADGTVLSYSALDLPAGASLSSQTFSWTPTFTQAGSYDVTFRVTDGYVTDEKIVNIIVMDTPLPDLTVTAISTTTQNISPSSTLVLSNTIKNIGTAAAGNSTVGFHLSTDAIYGGGDDIVLTATRTIASLNAGASSAASTTITIPTTTPTGNYYLCAQTDSANTVFELSEANNSRCTTASILIDQPDFVVTTLNGPVSANTGSNISINNTVKNQGAAKSASFVTAFYLSTDNVITTSDLRLGTRTISSLNAGASDSTATVVAIANTLAPGTYYLGAIADYNNVRIEQNENNNTLLGNSVSVTPGADLVMTAVSGPATATRGSSVAINSTVANQGTGSAGSFYVGLYLSSDSVITMADRFLGSRSLSSLSTGGANAAVKTVTIPTSVTAGTYYIGAFADYKDQRPEQNETNNSLAGNTIIIQ